MILTVYQSRIAVINGSSSSVVDWWAIHFESLCCVVVTFPKWVGGQQDQEVGGGRINSDQMEITKLAKLGYLQPDFVHSLTP